MMSFPTPLCGVFGSNAVCIVMGYTTPASSHDQSTNPNTIVECLRPLQFHNVQLGFNIPRSIGVSIGVITM